MVDRAALVPARLGARDPHPGAACRVAAGGGGDGDRARREEGATGAQGRRGVAVFTPGGPPGGPRRRKRRGWRGGFARPVEIFVPPAVEARDEVAEAMRAYGVPVHVLEPVAEAVPA